LRREGRRKRKAGAKNEKAYLIITLPLYRGQGKISQISKEFFFRKKKPLSGLKRGEKQLMPITVKNFRRNNAYHRLEGLDSCYPLSWAQASQE